MAAPYPPGDPITQQPGMQMYPPGQGYPYPPPEGGYPPPNVGYAPPPAGGYAPPPGGYAPPQGPPPAMMMPANVPAGLEPLLNVSSTELKFIFM